MILAPFSCLASPSSDVGHTSCGCYWVAESFYTLFWSNYASHLLVRHCWNVAGVCSWVSGVLSAHGVGQRPLSWSCYWPEQEAVKRGADPYSNHRRNTLIFVGTDKLIIGPWEAKPTLSPPSIVVGTASHSLNWVPQNRPAISYSLSPIQPITRDIRIPFASSWFHISHYPPTAMPWGF
jgi:hypothetical protein